ncbi:septal ring lytic transglycosylase RlpA family protein [Lichenicoccus sp.]|uniref:septal ring lytic transglycosylase RlpA family protein n=1 Tax=Lichenicoccus sp. TaxID=2781899 RepID=UPI003D0E36DF
MPRSRPPSPRHAAHRNLTLACLVIVAGLSSAQAGAATVTPPVTAWAASVHAALAAQARDARLWAHRKVIQTGLASWYGRDFAGHRTSSGTRFDPMRLTAAHRTLPLGTRLLVTSRTTGRSVVVTVNDRGPFAGTSRIIDLSRAAAVRLGMVRDGLNRVTLQRVAPAVDNDIEVAQAASGDDSTQAVTAAGPAAGR